MGRASRRNILDHLNHPLYLITSEAAQLGSAGIEGAHEEPFIFGFINPKDAVLNMTLAILEFLRIGMIHIGVLDASVNDF